MRVPLNPPFAWGSQRRRIHFRASCFNIHHHTTPPLRGIPVYLTYKVYMGNILLTPMFLEICYSRIDVNNEAILLLFLLFNTLYYYTALFCKDYGHCLYTERNITLHAPSIILHARNVYSMSYWLSQQVLFSTS